ncbi:alpha/beta fold hydrolase [Lederbergia citri]|uniref:Alpha/beta hydrolase n=1 Tax=Lederbergia citri TaxID=2833580 RepID=A0A942TJ32_9BACI|nr:alpha/beta hydrolase [Lederbergia citri]MBS4197701.1 alpha/beta hydrolase [Lederbergia citri]
MEKYMNLNININRKRKKSFSRAILSFLKWLGISLGILILIGFSYQQIVTRITADKYPTVGEIVDIGEYSLHLYGVGEAKNRPTIILESGLGTPTSYKDWENIQSKLSDYTRVISYDRAGYGWSDAAMNERTAEQIADDLHNLLNRAGENGPFILVGHSFGGFTSQVFSQKYKEDVAGLVLIDSSHVDDEGGFSKFESYLVRGLKEIGVGRLLGSINMLPLHEYFANDEVAVHFFHQRFYDADQISELGFLMTKSKDQVRAAQMEGYGELPLYILSAEHKDYPEWSDLQAQTASLSRNSKHIVVNDASHYIHLDQPEVVIESIVEMVENLK